MFSPLLWTEIRSSSASSWSRSKWNNSTNLFVLSTLSIVLLFFALINGLLSGLAVTVLCVNFPGDILNSIYNRDSSCKLII